MKYTVIYSDNLPEEFGGYCHTPIIPMFGTCRIVIRPKYKADVGLLNHELVHVKQYNRNFFHGVLYSLSKEYRYKAELEAYTAQIKSYSYETIGEAMWIVNSLFNKYELGLSHEKIQKDVQKIIDETN